MTKYVDVYGNTVIEDGNILIIEKSGHGTCYVTGAITTIPENLRGKIHTLMVYDRLTTIKSGMFVGLSNLNCVYFSKNLKCIENNAFADCISLKSVYLPDSVEQVSDFAFYECTGLKSIYVSNPILYTKLNEMQIYKGKVALIDSDVSRQIVQTY